MGHQYDVGKNKLQIFLLADQRNSNNADLISLSILFVMQFVCVGARRRLSQSFKWPLPFAEVEMSSTTFCNLFLYKADI